MMKDYFYLLSRGSVFRELVSPSWIVAATLFDRLTKCQFGAHGSETSPESPTNRGLVGLPHMDLSFIRSTFW